MPPWLKRFLFWSMICWVSAGPSFFFGYGVTPKGPAAILAMALGVVIFSVAYALITGTELVARIRRRRVLRYTLRVGYGTRVGLSVLFPIGMYVDVICGMLSYGLVDEVLGTTETFGAILVTTLIQGVVLNIVLAIYMLPVAGILKLAVPKQRPEGSCPRCGYDLRASTGLCPECGEPARLAPPVTRAA